LPYRVRVDIAKSKNGKEQEKHNRQLSKHKQHLTAIPLPQTEREDAGDRYHLLVQMFLLKLIVNLEAIGNCVVSQWKILLLDRHLNKGQLKVKEVPTSLYAVLGAIEHLVIHHKSHKQLKIGDAEIITHPLVRTSYENLYVVCVNHLNHSQLGISNQEC
jgi:hypothetical protein